MKILAIETSGTTSSVAIAQKDKILCQFYLDRGLKHSQTIMPMIQSCLDLSKININDIDVIAVSKGPGSFTGVRIGIAVAKGLSEGIGKGVIGVSTLEALAENISYQEGIICPLMDARREQIYGCIYYSNGNGNLTPLSEELNISMEEFFEILSEKIKNENSKDINIFFVGDGSEMCYNYYGKMNLPYKNIMLIPTSHRLQRANSIAAIAYKKLELDHELINVINSESLLPSYLRLPQAERERMANSI